MAFEDRCSPNQANSPGPVNGGVPQIENISQYSRNQYTCSTIEKRYERSVSPNLTLVKIQPTSPPPSPIDENQYYTNQDIKHENQPLNPIRRYEDILEPPVSINFSISNILHPEFGLNAIRKTNKIEGPKPVGPNHSILYKPYDLSRPAKVQKKLESKKLEVEFSRMPPLGGLRHTVSQIGSEKDVPKEPLKRPDSASSIVSSTSSGTSVCGNSESGASGTHWPAWVFCTRYSDRPSSG